METAALGLLFLTRRRGLSRFIEEPHISYVFFLQERHDVNKFCPSKVIRQTPLANINNINNKETRISRKLFERLLLGKVQLVVVVVAKEPSTSARRECHFRTPCRKVRTTRALFAGGLSIVVIYARGRYKVVLRVT